MDLERLGPWIGEEHLGVALQRYSEEMGKDPARLLVLPGFLRDEVAAQLATFLDEAAEYRVELGLYSSEDAVPQETWNAATDEDRFFRFEKLVGARPDAALSDPALAYMRFRRFLAEAVFREFMEAATGMSLGESDNFGGHAFRVGDYLRDHDDTDRDRALALVIYLSPSWRQEFGGALVMQDPSGVERHFDAEFNSAAIFDTLAGTTHRVDVVTDSAGSRARYTIGGWFPKPT